MTGLHVKLDLMRKSLSALEELPSKVTNLEMLLKTANEKQVELGKSLENMDMEMGTLRLKLNGLEQHNCSWSIRVNGIQLTEEEEANITTVKEWVFNNTIKPILDGAFEMGDLPKLPPANAPCAPLQRSLQTQAHHLPFLL